MRGGFKEYMALLCNTQEVEELQVLLQVPICLALTDHLKNSY